jgi:pimeloyl-ACP methyl ester carboxylesterase
MTPSSSGFIKTLRAIGIGLLAVIVVGYAGVCAYMYTQQDALVYMTDKTKGAQHPGDLPIEEVTFKTPDGVTLTGWYEPPPQGAPVVLFLHGQGADLNDGRFRYRRMHDKGVGYLAIDYRGFGGSDGKPSEQGLYTDALTAYDLLIAKGITPEQIIIHGHSLGSGVATWLATKRQAKALILEAPFTAAVDVAAERYPYLPVNLLMRGKFLNRERMKNIHIPVLIVHGDRDSVIPFAHGKRLFALANRPKNFVRMIGSDHSTLTRDGVYTIYWHYLGLDAQTAPASTGAVISQRR